MKSRFYFAIWVVVCIGVLLLVNCSNPLEGTGQDNPSPPDPGSVIDTVFNIDTLVVLDTLDVSDTLVVIDTVTIIDTLIVTDTLSVTDTLTYVDTVIVVEPGPDSSRFVCSWLESNHQVIIWMFRNEAGPYRLEFSVALETERPAQTLSVFIDDREYRWTPVENAELIVETDLSENAMVRILPKKPPSLGHAVHICLTLREL